MGPQIRLLQNNNTMMAEKIQSTIVNTIPLWKNQMVLALGLAHSQQAMQAERAVTDMTNDLLKKNAEALKMGTIETAKESQRGVGVWLSSTSELAAWPAWAPMIAGAA